MNKHYSGCLIIACICILSVCNIKVEAQCGATVTTFPYAEDFETSQGGWASGGTSGNDWAWGTPSKPVITGAGSGSKCWVVGGLTGSFYNYGERSWVKSPCFDFSGLQYPMIDFLIFWDSEHTYDGMMLQSSVDGGTTWKDVGAYGDTVNCMNQNWYNTSACTNLSGLSTDKNAWTGNNLPTQGSCQGGNGSLKWVTAKHCLTGLGGQASVMFRFAFGAGTTCNDFDGIAFDSVGIGESPLITASFTTTCLANRTVAFTGITSECPNSFNWNFGDPASGASNTATTINPTHTFSAPGSYTVTFIASGPCNAPATYTRVVNILGVVDSVHQVLCNGQANGSITLNVTGGVSPYTFNWGAGVTSQNRTGLSAGTYVVTVSDPQGCAIVDTIAISQPTALAVRDTFTPGTCSAGGTITLIVSGGTPAYTYNWGGGVTSENRTGLSAGTYTVTVTDANGCTNTASATIVAASALTVTATPTNITCFGGNNGAITVTDTGGLPNYTYNWGAGITTQNRTGLSVGSYTVTVTDRAGCTATATATITQPATAISISLLPVNATCSTGGAITTTATGGTGSYTYNWGGGITTQNRSGLAAGTYTVTVTDANGCTNSASTTITSSSTLSVLAVPANVLCFDSANGSILVTQTGGTGPYTYNWGGGITTPDRSGLAPGTYTVTVTDHNGCIAIGSATIIQPAAGLAINLVPTNVTCADSGTIAITVTGGTAAYHYNWGGGITTQNRTGLSTGNYDVTVTDASGCTSSASVSIVRTPALQVSETSTNVLCFDSANGSITLSDTDGTAPYTYNWGGGITTKNRNGLAAGTYTVMVSDQGGCVKTESITITQPGKILINAVSTITACDVTTGTITLTVTGGSNSNYTFRWSNGATTQNVTALAADTYTVTVTDTSGCTASASVVVSQAAGPQVTFTSTPISCNGGSDGTINSNATGGTPGYTYLWSNASISSGISGLSSGTYTVTVTDAHQCTAIGSDSLSNPPLLVVSANITGTIKCYGDTTGAVDAVVSGGTPLYNYMWNNGDSIADITGLGASTFSVIVTDQNGCSASSSNTIAQPTQLTLSATITDSASCGLANGAAQLGVNGGVKPYTYAWPSSVSDSSSAIGLRVGNYSVTITDSLGCTVLDTFSIGGKNSVVQHVYLGPDTSLCPGNNQTIILNAGTFVAYFWQDSSTKQYFAVTDTGTFWVIVTDSNGCKSSDSVVVADLCSTQFVVPNAFTPNGDGKNDFFVPFYIDAPDKYLIHIYNRWGQLVFESNSITNGWDGNLHGKAQPVDTYIYYIQYSYTGQKPVGLEGALELLR